MSAFEKESLAAASDFAFVCLMGWRYLRQVHVVSIKVAVLVRDRNKSEDTSVYVSTQQLYSKWEYDLGVP